jgi:dihydroorotate dehydrogenase
MFYRLTLKLLTNKNDGSVHSFAQNLIYIFCQLTRLNPFKRSQTISPVKVMRLTFSNPVGLAAGFDRTGKFLPYSEFIGFGSIELGTLNIDATKALDKSTVTTLQNLAKATPHKNKSEHPQQWGINLGSLRNTLDEQTVADYTRGMNLFWQYADYLVINLSRPESDARALKLDMYGLDLFLTNIKFEHQALCTEKRKYIPVLAKLAIDYHHNESMAHLLLLLKNRSYDGAILSFENWPNIQQITDYLTVLKTNIDDFPFIVVGGIRSTQDSQQVMAAGASLVQVYTALVQQGPVKTRKMIANLVGTIYVSH